VYVVVQVVYADVDVRTAGAAAAGSDDKPQLREMIKERRSTTDEIRYDADTGDDGQPIQVRTDDVTMTSP